MSHNAHITQNTVDSRNPAPSAEDRTKLADNAYGVNSGARIPPYPHGEGEGALGPSERSVPVLALVGPSGEVVLDGRGRPLARAMASTVRPGWRGGVSFSAMVDRSGPRATSTDDELARVYRRADGAWCAVVWETPRATSYALPAPGVEARETFDARGPARRWVEREVLHKYAERILEPAAVSKPVRRRWAALLEELLAPLPKVRELLEGRHRQGGAREGV